MNSEQATGKQKDCVTLYLLKGTVENKSAQERKRERERMNGRERKEKEYEKLTM